MRLSLLSARSLARIGIVLGLAFLVSSAVLVLVALLGPESAAPAATQLPTPSGRAVTTVAATEAPPSPASDAGAADSSVVASVNGYTITWSHLETATALNDVLSRMAGQDSLGGEETLQRLIDEGLAIGLESYRNAREEEICDLCQSILSEQAHVSFFAELFDDPEVRKRIGILAFVLYGDSTLLEGLDG